MLIDAHSHLDRYLLCKRFGKDIDHVLRQIEEQKILTVSNSMDLTSYRTNCRIAKKSRYVIPAFGIHPWNACRYVNKAKSIKRLIDETGIVGEIGLDHYYVKDKSKYPAQRKIFNLFLSRSGNKTVSVHTKGAEREALDLLRKHGNERVITHWFSGDLEVLNEMIEEGYYFSIVPEVKFSEHIREIVQNIPLNQLLTETDNPGGPASYLGEKGMPIMIRTVIEEVAKMKGETPKQIEKIVKDNFVRLAGPLEGSGLNDLL
jgi:TatD DNase family protein